MCARIFTSFFACLFLSMPASGEIHRCLGEHGEAAFSHRPCDGPAGTRLGVSGAPVGSGLRAGERARLQVRPAVRKSRVAPARRSAKNSSPSAADRQAYRCRAKRRALDAVSANLRRGYRAGQGEKLKRRRRAYRDYLSTYCS